MLAGILPLHLISFVMMKSALVQHIQQFVKVPPAALSAICEGMTLETLSKKDYLLQQDQYCQHQYFILQGCFRCFYINPKGMEQIINFAVENWWLADFDSLLNKRASRLNIQALEEAVVLKITREKLELILLDHPSLERYFRIIYEKIRIADQRRMQFMFDLSGEELYDVFYEANSDFVQRVPQYMLASYLGLTPQFLSKIRGRKRKNRD